MSFLTEIQRKYLKEALIIDTSYYDRRAEIPADWEILIMPIMNIIDDIYGQTNLSYLRGLIWNNYQELNEHYSTLVQDIEKLLKNKNNELIQKLIKNINTYSDYRMKEEKEDKYVIDFNSTIKANKNFLIYPPCSTPVIILKNDFGGKIETFDNLPQNDNSWITRGVKLSGTTVVKNNSYISTQSENILDFINFEIDETYITTTGSRTMRESKLIGSRVIDSTIDYSFVENSEIFYSHLNKVEVYNESRVISCELAEYVWMDNCQCTNFVLSGNKKYKNIKNIEQYV